MAVAFGSANSNIDTGNPTGTSLLVTLATSGSNRILFAGIEIFNTGGGDLVSGVTYGPSGTGQSMTQIAKLAHGGNYEVYLYYLLAPDTTAGNQVKVSLSASAQFIFACSASFFTGVNQVAPEVTNSGTVVLNGNITGNLTTLTDNDWTVLYAGNDDTISGAGAGTTIRSQPTGNRSAIGDSNAAITPPASTNLIFTQGASAATAAWVMAAIAPVGTPSTRDARELSLLGVG